MIKKYQSLAINKNYWLFFALILAILLLIITTLAKQEEVVLNKNTINQTKVHQQAQPPVINAKHALVFDQLTNQVLYAKDATVAYPVASVSKVLTAITSLQHLDKNSSVRIVAADLDTEGNAGLIIGEVWQLDQLIKFMLLNSSNDAASAIARTTTNSVWQPFSDLMAQTADEIGMSSDARWDNATGLDTIDGRVASNYASSLDIVKLLIYFEENYSDLARSSGDASNSFTTNLTTHQANSTNKLANSLPHIGSAKTGFTFVSGGNLAISASVGPARPIYIVVLGSTYEQRFNDVQKLYNYVENLTNI
jgi:D-alanyl-D-alanine endopeptidase (penicillin-binding protein 7)